MMTTNLQNVKFALRAVSIVAIALLNLFLFLAFEKQLFSESRLYGQRNLRVVTRDTVRLRLYKGVQPAPEKCPIGMYRRTGGGTSIWECEFCPRGVYGDSPGLVSADCTAKCPKGTYNDRLGAKSVLDCKLCPAGVYGSAPGLTTRACTGPCPYGKFSLREGLQSATECEDCPINYRGPQGRTISVPYYDYEGGMPCDRYMKGKTAETGRDINAAQTLNDFMASERVAHNTINDNRTP